QEARHDPGHGRTGSEREPPGRHADARPAETADARAGLPRRGRPAYVVARRGVPRPAHGEAHRGSRRPRRPERPPAAGARREREDPRRGAPGRPALEFPVTDWYLGESEMATVTLREELDREAREANRAATSLTDDAVAETLGIAAALVRERRAHILAANEADYQAARGRLDEGMLDRLRLDDDRVEGIAGQVQAVAEIEPLDREISSWTLPNGLQITERRIPIGTVGANFEARPNVALDVAGQLLKSLNTAVLRTGGAALRTVTVL